MRKSRCVTLGLLASFALVACNRNRTEMQRCVDDDNRVVDDSWCTSPGAYPQRFRWYYGGRGSYALGTRAFGGDYSPHAGLTATRSGAVSRGGFGGYFGHGSSSSSSSGGHAGSSAS